MKGRRTKGTWIFLLVVVFSLSLALSGCGLVDKLVSLRQDVNGEPEISLEDPLAEYEEWVLEEEAEDSSDGVYKLTLFFADQLGQHLVKEERVIPKVEGIGRAAINELIKGPDLASSLMPTLPDNTILLDINVKQDEGLAIVDFNRALIDNHVGGSSAEAVTVYSIVNTLTQFPTVDSVQILVNGQYVDTIAGHVDISQPLTKNDLIVK